MIEKFSSADANSFCLNGGCVEVVPVVNREDEQEYLVRSNLPDAAKSAVEVFTQGQFNVLVTEAATAPNFAESRFTQAPKTSDETRFHL